MNIRKVTPAPPPEYVITLREDEISTFKKMMRATTYSLASHILAALEELG